MIFTNLFNYLISFIIKPSLFNIRSIDEVVLRVLRYVEQKCGAMNQEENKNIFIVALMTISLLVVEGMHRLLAIVVDKLQYVLDNVSQKGVKDVSGATTTPSTATTDKQS